MKNSIKSLTDSEIIDLIRSETKYKIKVHSNLSALLNEAADRLERKMKGGGMNANEIIKALECCSKITNCQVDCSRFNDCILIHLHEVLELINRLQAENERLKTMHSEMCIGMKVIKRNARKEFAERLKVSTYDKSIDNLLEEMESEEQ